MNNALDELPDDSWKMCNSCFNKEIKKFESQVQFESFNKVLDKKLKSDDKFIFKQKRVNHSQDSYELYECISCETKWCLSKPHNVWADNTWRGYFLTEPNCLEYLDELGRERKRGTFGCLIILLLTIAMIIYLTLR